MIIIASISVLLYLHVCAHVIQFVCVSRIIYSSFLQIILWYTQTFTMTATVHGRWCKFREREREGEGRSTEEGLVYLQLSQS